MFGNQKSKNWDTTKSIVQNLIGKADEELTDAELVDAILESAKSKADDADADDATETKTKGKADDKGEKKEAEAEGEAEKGAEDPQSSSEFSKLIAKIDLIANGQTELGKRMTKIEAMRAKAATGGEREVESEKGKTRFDSKKDAPVFVEE